MTQVSLAVVALLSAIVAGPETHVHQGEGETVVHVHFGNADLQTPSASRANLPSSVVEGLPTIRREQLREKTSSLAIEIADTVDAAQARRGTI